MLLYTINEYTIRQSVFFFEIQEDADAACAASRKAFEEATADLEEVHPFTHKHPTPSRPHAIRRIFLLFISPPPVGVVFSCKSIGERWRGGEF